MICMGLVRKLGGVVFARCILSFAEGSLFPGVRYYITVWYPRHESGLRMALFFSMATAAGSFGGLLSRAISEMLDVGGETGWSWIFMYCVASVPYRAICDYPGQRVFPHCSLTISWYWSSHCIKFLTESKRNGVIRCLADNRQLLSNDWNTKYIWHAFRDWKNYINMFMVIGVNTPLYSLSLFAHHY